MPARNNKDDRRAGHRFPLRLPVRYRSAGADWMLGESVDISRAGLLFTTPEAVKPGDTVEASIAWPVFLDNRVPLQLVIEGPVVRSAGDLAAISFAKYEFRTCQTPSELNLSNLISRGL
jgi:hypothetical protein